MLIGDTMMTNIISFDDEATLCGFENGQKERQNYNIDQYENSLIDIAIVISPISTILIDKYYIAGLFKESLKKFETKREFWTKYTVYTKNEDIRNTIVDGIDYLYDKYTDEEVG